MDHQPEASSSTGAPPIVHTATLVFDSGLSRERFSELIGPNGSVPKVVQRLTEKYGGEQAVRIGLVITAQDAPYHNPRALHSLIPAYRQDFRRPSSFITSLPSLLGRFTPQAALARPKPGSLLSDVWDIEDGAGLSITSSEPGPSDHFLSGIVGGIELLDHQAHLNFVPPPNALRQVSPDSALPMLSMMYRAQGGAEERQQHLLVFTEKASLQATESDARHPHAWARTDTSADYDDFNWDNIGDKCKAKDIACSAIIVGSPEASQTVSSPGRDGSQSVERLRKMCQASSTEPPNDPWFPLPPDSVAILTGMTIVKPTSPPAGVGANGASVPQKQGSQDPSTPQTSSEAQIKYQQAQKQALAYKMAVAAAQAGGGGGPALQALANLIQNGRLDPTVMAQLIANMKHEDPATRHKAMQQLSSLVQPRNQNNANMNAATQALNNMNGNQGPSNSPSLQQQQFLAAMQARQQQQQQQQNAQAGNNQNNAAQTNAQQPQQPQQQQSQQPQQPQQQQQQQQNQQQPQMPGVRPPGDNKPTPQQQQQQLLQQQQQMLALQNLASQQNTGNTGGNLTNNPTAPGTAVPPRPNRVWQGSISWTMKGSDNKPQKWVIPVDCTLLSPQVNPNDLHVNTWPSTLEMSGMSGMNMAELQQYVKAHQAPCVLFTVNQAADAQARGKIQYLTMMLGAKNLCAFIRFGAPGCGILLISSNGSQQQTNPAGEKIYRLLGVVCLKVPFLPGNNMLNPMANQQANQQNQQNPQQQAAQAAVNGRPGQIPINGPPGQFSISPQFLQQAQMQAAQLQQQQQNTPQNQARTPQNLGTTPQPQQTTPQQQTTPRVPNPALGNLGNNALQQFANQPNVNTIQQLQLRQLQAQAQAQAQGQGAQNMQNLPRPTLQFTPQQRAGIIKIMRDAGLNVSDSFDPASIPKEQLAAFINSARERGKAAAQQQAQQAQAAVANKLQQGQNVGINGPTPNLNLGNAGNAGNAGGLNLGNLGNLGNNTGLNLGNLNAGNTGGLQLGNMPFNMLPNNDGQQQGLQLGQFAGLQQQFQQGQQNQNQQNSALGLFAQGQQGMQGNGVNPQLPLGLFQHQ